MLLAPTHYWHTIPLHLAPTLFYEGFLRASAFPRPRVYARRRKLGLTHYIHLSLTPATPLLADKRARGYPHVLLAFAPEIAALPGAGYCRYNQKAWRHRDAFLPITDAQEKEDFLYQWSAGKYPSAELLVPHTLPLEHATTLYLASEREADWLAGLALETPPVLVDPGIFPPAPPLDLKAHHDYAAACRAAATVLPPPSLPFD